MHLYIDKRNALDTLFLCILNIPITVEQFPAMAAITKYSKWCALFYALLLLLQKRVVVEKIDSLVFAWFGITLFSVIINGGGFSSWFSKYYPFIVTYIIAKEMICRDTKKAIRTFSLIFAALIIGNTITWLFPGTQIIDELGQPLYFLGIRTRISDFAFIAISMLIIYRIISDRRRQTMMLLIVIVSTVTFCFSEWVSNAVVALILYAMLLYLFYKRPKLAKSFGIVLLFLSLIVAYLIIGVRIQDSLSWLIVDFLGEDITMNGRTTIWDSVLSQMGGIHWVYGFGTRDNANFTVSLLNSRTTSATHSQFLHVLYYYGIVGMALFYAIPIKGIIRNNKHNDFRIRGVLITTLSILMLTGISEITCDTTCYYVFLAVVNYSELIKTEEELYCLAYGGNDP